MNGTIGIKDLKVSCLIGIYPHERVRPQDLFIDIEVIYDFTNAHQSEKVKDTIDYAIIAQKITELGVNKKYQLIETYAVDALEWIKKQYQTKYISVCIKKPGAIPNAQYPYVKVSSNND